jgi:hypothetical protein
MIAIMVQVVVLAVVAVHQKQPRVQQAVTA